MKRSYTQAIIIVILGISLAASVVTCRHKVATREQKITQLQLDNQTSQETINKQGQTIASQGVLVTNSKQAIKDLTDTLFNQKSSEAKKIADVIAYYRGVTKTEIKEVKVPYVDSSLTKKWEDSVSKECAQVIDYYEKNAVEVPKQAKEATKDYNVSLTVNKEGVTIDSLSLVDSQYLRFVTLKGGLLKKDLQGKRHLWLDRQIQVQVLHTNPYISVLGQNSAIYVAPKKPQWLLRAIIFGGGVFLGSKL